jgi:hypothetical protein
MEFSDWQKYINLHKSKKLINKIKFKRLLFYSIPKKAQQKSIHIRFSPFRIAFYIWQKLIKAIGYFHFDQEQKRHNCS